MRAALISLAGQPRDARGEPLRVAGKTVARRQLDFALAAGCERIFALGDGACPEAISLGHVAERAGARFQAITDSRGLLGAVRATDALLVLAPGLVPDCAEALEWLRVPCVLTGPPDAVAAGFERIDLERAWAGGLLMPGQLVERLAELAPNSEPAPALLRIALQGRVKLVPVPPSVTAEGSWAMARPENAATIDRSWLERNLPPVEPWALSRRAVQAVLAQSSFHQSANDRTPDIVRLGAAGLLIIAAVVALLGWGAPAFAVLAAGAFLAAGADVLGAVLAAPFAQRKLAASHWLAIAVDLALVACGAGAIIGSWLDRLFAPLMLVGLLRTARWPSRAPALALLGDRAVLAVALAVASAFGLAKPAIMIVALVLLGLKVAETGPASG